MGNQPWSQFQNGIRERSIMMQHGNLESGGYYISPFLQKEIKLQMIAIKNKFILFTNMQIKILTTTGFERINCAFESFLIILISILLLNCP